jgi:hypothetical protein
LREASVAIDGSKFKAVNNRDKNFTRAKMERGMAQIEESVARYLQQLDNADRQEPSEAVFIRKWVAPIRALIVPKGCSTVSRRWRIFSGCSSSRRRCWPLGQ